MNTINCPICQEIVLTTAGRRENCVDIWFELSDNSNMPIMICSNCLVDFMEEKADIIFQTIKNQWTSALQSHPESKQENFDRIDKLTYKRVYNRIGDLIVKNLE